MVKVKKRGQIRWDNGSFCHFCILGVLMEIWGILRVLVSYEITRGIRLVVGRVTERVNGGFWGV